MKIQTVLDSDRCILAAVYGCGGNRLMPRDASQALDTDQRKADVEAYDAQEIKETAL